MHVVKSKIPLNLLLLAGCLIMITACGPSKKDLMWHVDHYKPTQAAPIDGTWRTPWNDRTIIDRGRMYLPDSPYYPMGVLMNIARVAPGKYRAEGTGSQQIQGKNITLSVVSADKLVILSDMTEVAYTLVKAKNPKWFQADYALTLESEKSKTSQATSLHQDQPIVIHQALVQPARVARGDMLKIKASFSIDDQNPSTKTAMVSYFYEIASQGKRVFRSTPKTIEAAKGAKIPLEIELKAASNLGDYTIVLEVSHSQGKTEKQMAFSIVTSEEAAIYVADKAKGPGSVEDRLIGKWKFDFSSNSPSPELLITRKDGKLYFFLNQPKARAAWKSQIELIELNDQHMKLRTKEIGPENCWYVVEDVITFNDQMDGMDTRSQIIDGSWCVKIGQIFKSKMRRAE